MIDMTWIVMPRNVESFSCQQQPFKMEAETTRPYRGAAEKRGLARVPAHFVPILLNIGGYEVARDDERPADIPDLLPTDPLRDNALNDLSGQLSAARAELESVRVDMEAAFAKSRALTIERDQLARQVADLTLKLREVTDELEELKEDKE
jgi:hypothetical protein